MTQLCYGIVSEVRNKPLRVKATLPDYDNMTTPWMLVLQPRTRGTRHYDPPVKDEEVACLMLDNFETGLCLGSVYNDEDLEPVEGKQFYREFSDGTVLAYNPETHELLLSGQGEIKLVSTSKISLSAPNVSLNGA
jgi:phage baseplate assembly protein V